MQRLNHKPTQLQVQYFTLHISSDIRLWMYGWMCMHFLLIPPISLFAYSRKLFSIVRSFLHSSVRLLVQSFVFSTTSRFFFTAIYLENNEDYFIQKFHGYSEHCHCVAIVRLSVRLGRNILKTHHCNKRHWKITISKGYSMTAMPSHCCFLFIPAFGSSSSISPFPFLWFFFYFNLKRICKTKLWNIL